MSSMRHVHLHIHGNVASLTLARPPVNALDPSLIEEVETSFGILLGKPEISVLTVKSAQKVFCAGADLDGVAAFLRTDDPGAELRPYADRVQALVRQFEALPFLTVCELKGSAMGGGLEFALAADFRVASDRARLGLPELALGLIPAAGGTQRLARLCGVQTARRLILRGRILNALEAFDLQLIDEVFPFEEFDQKASEFVAQLAAQPGQASRCAKACISHYDTAVAGGFEAEVLGIANLIASSEAQDRIRAFVAKSAMATPAS